MKLAKKTNTKQMKGYEKAALLMFFLFGLLSLNQVMAQSMSPQYIGVDVERIVQEQSNWCWVACAQMIFKYYDHPVKQSDLVTMIYGAPVNMPAMLGLNLSSLFNRTYTDTNGNSFRSILTGVYDLTAGIQTIDNGNIVAELLQGRPLVIGVSTHAVVLEGVSFFQTPSIPNIIYARIVDPWPTSPSIYDISGNTIVPRINGGELLYVCTIRVEDIK